MSISEYRDTFLLKGALLFELWYEQSHRPTRDIDLLARTLEDQELFLTMVRSICLIECEDGINFLPESVKIQPIRMEAKYGGFRVNLLGMLGNARCPMQIDIGFGDAVTPSPQEVMFPTLLDGIPAPSLKAYSKETVIAEKLETIVTLGMINSRMKDYFDLYTLSMDTSVDDSILKTAIVRTFDRRDTLLPSKEPIGLTNEFSDNIEKARQWQGFCRKNGIELRPLSDIVESIRTRFWPLLQQARKTGAQ
jgi:hypothetical protein